MQYDHILKNVGFIQAYVTPAVGHFWPKGHDFNTFGRGDAAYQIPYQGSKPCGFRKDFFFKFSLLKPV